MRRRWLIVMVAGLLTMAGLAFAGGSEEDGQAEGEPVTLVYLAYQPEYRSAEQQIWDIYEEENPNVKIEIIEANEDGSAELIAKIMAGEAPHIGGHSLPGLNLETAHLYYNLTQFDIPYLDDLASDEVALTKELLNIDGLLSLNVFQGRRFTWVWHKDLLRNAGLLDQAEAMTTWDNVDAFLAALKTYVDGTSDVDYVFDFGWHSWVIAENWLPMFAVSLGEDVADTSELYKGEIAWTDLENNPYVVAFEKMKEYYDLGYLPEQWWLRGWEAAFESSFVGKKSAFTWHGPWIWTKASAADPDAELGGAPLPASPVGGELLNNLQGIRGGVVYSQWADSELMPEIEKAFVWWHSPEVTEMRGEAYNFLPNFLSLMPVQSDSVQYTEAIAEVFEGQHGTAAHWIDYAYGPNAVIQFKIKGSENVIGDSQAAIIGQYMEGEVSLMGLMEVLQTRWEQIYAIP